MLFEVFKDRLKTFEFITDNATSGMSLTRLIYDGQGKALDLEFVEANKSYHKIFGLKYGYLPGKTLKEIYPDLTQGRVDEFSRMATRAGSINRLLFYENRNSKYLDTTLMCPKKGYLVSVIRDITLAKQMEKEFFSAWVKLLDLRNGEVSGHSQRVVEMTAKMARLCGMRDGEIENIKVGAMMHDIGKMGIPDKIIFKKSKLTPKDIEVIKKHPVYARELLEKIYIFKDCLDIPYYHHERWDGNGYPEGLRGEKIPLAARIFSIVDVWDALTNNRSYRKAWRPERATKYMMMESGKMFDPRILEIFLKEFGTGYRI